MLITRVMARDDAEYGRQFFIICDDQNTILIDFPIQLFISTLNHIWTSCNYRDDSMMCSSHSHPANGTEVYTTRIILFLPEVS